jgi:hypothetical protein
MGVSRGPVSFYLSEHHGDGSPGIHLTIERIGIEDFHRELQAKNYRFMNPSLDATEWGTRDVTVIDPVGNHLRFSERIKA